jgi:LmbE family N-acetylglucosaminyl deacetylase
MFTLDASRIERVLLLGAHADDIEIGCGGTVLTLLAALPDVGVRWVVFSAEGIRAAEAKRSAALFLESANASQVDILDYPDTLFPTRYAELKDELGGIRDEFRPDVVFTHRREDAHQDHRALGELAWGAFRGGEWILEYEIPKYEGDLGAPNVFAPLTEAILNRKLDLLWDCFESQRSKPWFSKEQLAATALLRGLESKGGQRHAEGFYSRKSVLSFQRDAG